MSDLGGFLAGCPCSSGSGILGPTRSGSPTSGRYPTHSGFLAGRARVGSGFRVGPDKSTVSIIKKIKTSQYFKKNEVKITSLNNIV